MTIKKLTFCILCSVNAANLAADKDFNNEKSSISTVERDSSIPKNNYNTREWGSIYLLFNPMTHFVDYFSEKTKLTFFRIFTGDILYRYIAKKGVGVMVKFGFNSTISALDIKNIIRLSPSLTLSFCWVYKKKGKKLFSGSFCPVGMGWYNILQEPKTSLIYIEKNEYPMVDNKENDIYNKEKNVKNLLQNKKYQEDDKEEKPQKKPVYRLSKKSVFIFFLTINYLHYENGKGFFLSWGQFNMVYSKTLLESIGWNIFFSLLYLELGFSLLKSKHRKKNIDL